MGSGGDVHARPLLGFWEEKELESMRTVCGRPDSWDQNSRFRIRKTRIVKRRTANLNISLPDAPNVEWNGFFVIQYSAARRVSNPTIMEVHHRATDHSGSVVAGKRRLRFCPSGGHLGNSNTVLSKPRCRSLSEVTPLVQQPYTRILIGPCMWRRVRASQGAIAGKLGLLLIMGEKRRGKREKEAADSEDKEIEARAEESSTALMFRAARTLS
ncbi:hypothetical protein BGY98DRAFT_934402 [Russula aff. rugulosa BPL654]|nr:hypothetical protein BGY98DRAFT_934402 [Russula aff. rugulosa BPL654]